MSTEQFQDEINSGKRFKFGENWKNFLSTVNEERIKQSEISLKTMLGVDSLESKSFLDVGSGSGLFHLRLEIWVQKLFPLILMRHLFGVPLN